MSADFASAADLTDKTITFDAIGPDLYAFTAEGDPNSGVIVGDDGVMVIDAQATPVMARQVIERVAKVTDKPIKYLLLTHYHAVRVLGASAYAGAEILASAATRALIAERGKADMDSEIGRFPRLFRFVESIPGLTWPSITFPDQISVWLGRREIRILHIGRGHTAGDVVAFVPDANVVFFRRPRRIPLGLLLRRCAFHRLAGDARPAGGVFRRGAVAGPRRGAEDARRGRRRHRFDRGLSHYSVRRGDGERRQGTLAQGDLRRHAPHHGSEVCELRHLRALHAVQRRPRL